MSQDSFRTHCTAVVGAVITCALAVTFAAGCSSSGAGRTGPGSGTVARQAGPVTVCAKDAGSRRVKLPDDFPGDFPFPPGTVIYSTDDRGTGGRVVTGVTSAPFKEVLRSLQQGLAANGYTPTEGEIEPHDAESNWRTTGFDGRWAIREIAQCPGDTIVNVVARATN